MLLVLLAAGSAALATPAPSAGDRVRVHLLPVDSVHWGGVVVTRLPEDPPRYVVTGGDTSARREGILVSSTASREPLLVPSRSLRLTGTLTAVDGDTVTFAPDGSEHPGLAPAVLRLPRAAIMGLEVSAGRKKTHAKTWAGIGLALGAGGAFAARREPVIGAVSGAVVSAAVAVFVRRARERWVPGVVPLARAVAPPPAGGP